MDISVPDREISVLNNTNIAENRKNQDCQWGIQKFQFFNNDLFSKEGS